MEENIGYIDSSIESKGDSWIIRIRDVSDTDVNIECNSVDEYAKKIEEIGQKYSKIEVNWMKDVYLKPEHFSQVQEQMALYKED